MNRSLSATILATMGSLTGCASTGSDDRAALPANDAAETQMLAEFDGDFPRLDELSGEWRTINDNIMGGRSLGGGAIRNGAMVFAGSTNTNGGGFSSIRASDTQWDLTGFDGLGARVRADGRRYIFLVMTGLSYNNGEVFYRGEFKTEPLVNATGDAVSEGSIWQKVFVPFGDFVPMVRGRSVADRVESLDPSKIRGIGLMIDDGLDGPFRLEVDWIRAESHENPSR